MPLLYCLINLSSTNSAISPYYSFDYCFQHIHFTFSFFVFLGHVDWISCISPLYFPYFLSSFYRWVLMMSVHISHFSLVFDLLSIAVNNICNSVVLFFISIQSAWTTVSKNLAKSVWQELPLPLPHPIPLHIWQDASSSITSLVITDHPGLCSARLLLLGPCSQNTPWPLMFLLGCFPSTDLHPALLTINPHFYLLYSDFNPLSSTSKPYWSSLPE